MTAAPVLVAGASGFVGRRLVPALAEAGHEVRAMTRHPDTYEGEGKATYGDVHDAESLPEALEGVRAAYYLVHSLASKDFERLGRRGSQDLRRLRRRGRCRADRLPRRAGPGGRPALQAPAQPA